MPKRMTRRRFLQLTGGICGLWATSNSLHAMQSRLKRKPNFVLIMTDDAGPDLFGCYGGNVNTPHIDWLAKEGVQFETCWATPMCSPTRAMIMTGRYASRTGWYHNQLSVPFTNHDEIDFTQHGTLLFSNLLQRCGYKTAITGRWGIPILFDPQRHGFDEYCLHRYYENQLPEGSRFTGLVESEEGYGLGPVYSRYWHPVIVQNGKLLKTQPEDFATDFYADFAVDFAGRHKDQPFFIYMPLHLPHQTAYKEGNAIATTPLSGRPGKLTGGTFEECMQYADLMIGRVIEGLRKAVLLNDTIIMVTSDNGSCGIGKCKATARGPRVPMVVYGPKYIKSKGRSRALVSLADVTPTLLDFAGGILPNGYEFDGKSLVPCLTGRCRKHRTWLYSYIGTARMLRDEKWVLEAVDEILYNSPGRFYDTNGSSDPDDYVEVTDSKDAEVIAAKICFIKKLGEIPHLDPNNELHLKAIDEYKQSKYPHQMG